MLRCDSTADFLAALPRLVGFTAPDSLFIALFVGSRAQGALRVDLPVNETAPVLQPYLDEVERCLDGAQRQFGAGAPAIVISSSQTFAAAQGAPWRRLARQLDRRLSRAGRRPRELCCLAPDGWVSFADSSAPRLGRPLAEISASRVAEASTIPELSELGAFRAVPPDERAAVDSALGAAPTQGPRQGHAGIDRLFARPALSPRESAQLLAALQSEAGWARAFDTVTAHAAESLVDSPAGRTAIRSLGAASEHLAFLVPLLPRASQPTLIALSALAWWARGLESVAQRQLAEALEINPDHEISQLALRVIRSGRLVTSAGPA